MGKIIIIGVDHHNTLSMVRCFGESGYRVILIVYGDKESYVAKSKYIEKAYIVQSASDALSALIQICSSEELKPVVITCPDEISSMMDLRYEEFKDLCYFFNAKKAGRVTHYMDKQVQLKLANDVGFNVPSSLESLPTEVDYSSVKYPCFVKPKESIHGGKNLARCDDERQLRHSLKKYPDNLNVLIQDFLQKDYEIVIPGLTVRGSTHIPGFIKKHREFRGGTTYSTVYPISWLDPEIVESCKRMVGLIQYEGLWGIELIKNDGGYWFVELNLRNDATSYALSVAGANLPMAYYESAVSEDKKIEFETVREINSMVEFEDFNFVVKGKVSPWKWYSQIKHSECRYLYSENDKGPYYLRRKEYLKFLRHRILHI